MGRLDWEAVLEELTPHQLRVLLAYSEIEPWGDDRNDLRAALNSAAVIHGIGGKCKAEFLYRYLPIHEHDELADASPDKSASFLVQMMGR